MTHRLLATSRKHHRETVLRRANLCLLGVVWLGVAGMSDAQEPAKKPTKEPAKESAVDETFYKQRIAPLLRKRCYHCHSSEQEMGRLRLDIRELAHVGGASGKPLLSTDLKTSELYQRITSEDKKTRMPLGGTPLTAEQIDLIARWLKAGSPWPKARFGMNQSRPWWIDWLEKLDPYLPRKDTYWESLQRMGFYILAVLLVFLVAERARVQLRKGKLTGKSKLNSLQKYLAKIPRLAFLVLLFSLMFIVDRMNTHRLSATLAKYKAEAEKNAASEKATADLPMPYHPMHPPRLGGTYYRGNDERDPKLFNRGFYRTATFELSLCQSDRTPWDVDAAIDGQPLFIRLVIERAPRATPALFTTEIMRDVFLCQLEPKTPKQHTLVGKPVFFTELQASEKWDALYPLEPLSPEHTSEKGMIYVFTGKVVEGVPVGEIQYGISYTLHSEAGLLAADSELWMGAILLTGNVMKPREGSISLPEWFDFREIPVITKPNSTDPELLGVEEHKQGNEQPAKPNHAP